MSRIIKVAGWTGALRGNAVFVHGLGGHPFDTWRSGDGPVEDDPTFWPRWLAEDVEGLSVFVLGYDAPASNWAGTSMAFHDRAVNVRQRLLAESGLSAGPITFICHSLGGLIIKQVLLDLHQRKDRDAEALRLLNQVRQVVFLATPHAGSRKASLLAHLSFLAWPTSTARALAANDPAVRKINVDYRGLADEKRASLRHLVFYETHGTAAGLIVEEASGDPGLHAEPVPIDADHITIAKAADRGAVQYSLLRNLLLACPTSGDPGRLEQLPVPAYSVSRPRSSLVPKLARVAVLAAFVAVGVRGAWEFLDPTPSAAAATTVDALTFAAILAAIADEETRLKVAELQFRRPLSSEERDLVIAIRSDFREVPELDEEVQESLRDASTPEELASVLARLDVRPCNGETNFVVAGEWLRCQSGGDIPTIASANAGGDLASLEALVFHFSAGASTAADLRVYLGESPALQASTHLLVARSGAIVQLVPFDRRAWHAGRGVWAERNLSGMNGYSVAVSFTNLGELRKQPDGTFKGGGRVVPAARVFIATRDGRETYWESYTPEQLDAAAGIVRAFRAVHPDIALLAHSEISDMKTDPGPAFPLEELRKL